MSWIAAGALLALATLLFRAGLYRLPDRLELGPRTVALRFEPVALGGAGLDPFQVIGAWRVHADDPRFGGISALAIDGGRLVALSDSGVVARFRAPGTGHSSITLRELPGGPGDGGFKSNRDSEALTADPAGRGWWVSFENRDELWLYDRALGRAVRRVKLNGAGLGYNRGIEGMTAIGGELLLFPERGEKVMRLNGNAARISGVSGWISDAVRLPDGRLLVANRRPTPIGLGNSLVFLELDGAGYRAGAGVTLPLGRLDNVEALAAEALPGGAARLWVMTDNNLQQHRATLLIALELRPRPAPR